jgi:hypothetical protein
MAGATKMLLGVSLDNHGPGVPVQKTTEFQLKSFPEKPILLVGVKFRTPFAVGKKIRSASLRPGKELSKHW